jgi:hypothetical protein
LIADLRFRISQQEFTGRHLSYLPDSDRNGNVDALVNKETDLKHWLVLRFQASKQVTQELQGVMFVASQNQYFVKVEDAADR